MGCLNFEIANFPFLDGDVFAPIPMFLAPILQVIRFARVFSNAGVFDNRNQFIYE